MNDMVNRPAGNTAVAPVDRPMPAVFLHCAVFLANGRVLGDEAFRLVSLQGQENVSEPFEFQLELHGNTSPLHGTPLDFRDVVGRPVTVGIDQSAADEPGERFVSALRGQYAGDGLVVFNGIAADFAMEAPGIYRLTLRPALWRLSLTNRYCIHEGKNIRDAIAGVLNRHRIEFSMEAVSGDDNLAVARVQDWLQAGETDFDFVRRLMAKAHIYYYFTHTGKSHTLVFANRPAYPNVFADGRPLRYTYTSADELGLRQNDVIAQYSYQQSLTSSGVRGVLARQEAAWENDAVARYQTFQANSGADLGELPFNLYKIFQYGCSDDEAAHYTDAAASALATSGARLSGASYCGRFHAAHQFRMTGSVMADMVPMPVRPSFEGQWFVLTQVQHQASLDAGYQNQFQAAEAAGLVTAFSVQDTQQGVVMARVLKTEQPKDWKYYRKNNFDPRQTALTDAGGNPSRLAAKGVVVQFSTDGGASDEVWVKLAPHMTSVPEVGVTVMVSRANDESELPEIQSIVQNNGTRTVTPSGWTANTHVGSSYSTSYGDNLSVRFGRNSLADLDRAVAIISGEYASGKFKDAGYSQGASYSYSTSENGKDGILSKSDSFGSTYSCHHGAESRSETVFDNTDSQSTVTGTSTSTSTLNTVRNSTTINAQSNSTAIGASNSNDAIGVSNSNSAIGASNGNTAIGVSFTNSATGISVQNSLNGISASSALVGQSNSFSMTGISSQTSAVGASTNDSAVGTSVNNSLTGSSVSNSVTGSSQNHSITGISANASLVGLSAEASAVGVSSHLSAVGVSASLTFKGASVDISQTGSANSVSLTGTIAKVEVVGGGVEFKSDPALVKTELVGPDITLLSAIKMIM